MVVRVYCPSTGCEETVVEVYCPRSSCDEDSCPVYFVAMDVRRRLSRFY